MKILQAFSIFNLPYGGGTVDLVCKLSKALQRNNDVVIYTSDYKIDRSYMKQLHHVVAFHSKINLPGFYFTPSLFGLWAKSTIAQQDIIHFHVQRSIQNIIIQYYAHKYNIPYVIDAHGSTPTNQKKLLKKLYDLIWGNKAIKKCSRFIAESPTGKQEYIDLGIPEDKITIIPPPFSVDDYHNLPPKGKFRYKYTLDNKKIIMSFGRLHWIKGGDFLIDSYKLLTTLRDDTALVFVGQDDGYKSELEKMAKAYNIEVLFTGFLDGTDKLEALVDADIVIQPSRHEQGAWSSMEAVLCGTPIIVTEGTGAGDDVNRLKAGWTCEFGNVRKLVSSILWVFDHHSVAMRKTLKASENIKHNHSMEAKLKLYEQLYQECIKGNK